MLRRIVSAKRYIEDNTEFRSDVAVVLGAGRAAMRTDKSCSRSLVCRDPQSARIVHPRPCRKAAPCGNRGEESRRPFRQGAYRERFSASGDHNRPAELIHKFS